MRSLTSRLAASALALVAFSCNIYDGSLLSEGPGDPLVRQPAGVPPRPDASNAGDNDLTYTIALRNVVLNMGTPGITDCTGPGNWSLRCGPEESVLWADDARCAGITNCVLGDVTGINLDGFETTPTNGRTECVPPANGALPRQDGLNGIDNYFGAAFFSNVSLVLPTFEADAVAAQEVGFGTIVVQIRGWNGMLNDNQVAVVVMQAIDGTSAAPSDVHWGTPMGGCPGTTDDQLLNNSDNCPAPNPGWAGQDTWWVRRDNFAINDINRPLLSDSNAWVSGGSLVLRLPDRQDILFFSGDVGVPVRLSEPYAVAKLSADLSGNADEIIFAGRWDRNVLLDIADYVGICEGIREILDGIIAINADVLSDPVDVGALNDPTSECDAISMAALFQEGVIGQGIVMDPTIVPPQLVDLCP